MWFCDLADYLLTCLRYGLASRQLRHLLEDDDEIPDVKVEGKQQSNKETG